MFENEIREYEYLVALFFRVATGRMKSELAQKRHHSRLITFF